MDEQPDRRRDPWGILIFVSADALGVVVRDPDGTEFKITQRMWDGFPPVEPSGE